MPPSRWLGAKPGWWCIIPIAAPPLGGRWWVVAGLWTDISMPGAPVCCCCWWWGWSVGHPGVPQEANTAGDGDAPAMFIASEEGGRADMLWPEGCVWEISSLLPLR